MILCRQEEKNRLNCSVLVLQANLVGKKAKDRKKQRAVGHMKIIYSMPQSKKDPARNKGYCTGQNYECGCDSANPGDNDKEFHMGGFK